MDDQDQAVQQVEKEFVSVITLLSCKFKFSTRRSFLIFTCQDKTDIPVYWKEIFCLLLTNIDLLNTELHV